MKLKYFLRGVGMGIIITTLILMIGFNTKGKMTDDQIINRALELGLVYSSNSDGLELATATVAEPSSSSQAETNAAQTTATQSAEAQTTATETTTAENTTTEAVTTETATTEAATTETATTEAATTEAATIETYVAETTTEKPVSVETTAESYTFSIQGGTSSYRVAVDLYEHGMVDNPDTFDEYLENTGYSNIIRIGQFTVTRGMSYEDIALIITGRR